MCWKQEKISEHNNLSNFDKIQIVMAGEPGQRSSKTVSCFKLFPQWLVPTERGPRKNWFMEHDKEFKVFQIFQMSIKQI